MELLVEKSKDCYSSSSISSSNSPNQIKLAGIPMPVMISSIIHLKGDCNYTWVFLVGKSKPILTSHTLKWYEDQLKGFIRVHKTDLINSQFIKMIELQKRKEIQIQLVTGYKVQIARRRIPMVLEILSNN